MNQSSEQSEMLVIIETHKSVESDPLVIVDGVIAQIAALFGTTLKFATDLRMIPPLTPPINLM
jgi:hypothetical protein